MGQNNSNISTVLSEITNELVGQFKLYYLLNNVVEMAMRLLNAEVCSIFLDDKENGTETIVMMAGSGFAKKLVGKAKYNTGEGLTGYIYKTGSKFNFHTQQELVNLEDDKGKQIWSGKHDKQQWETGNNEFRNMIALPLKIKGQIFGVIKVENKLVNYGDHFSDEDETMFEIIANVVSLAIENARLYQKTENQLKAISAKAAHRINNQATNYDWIALDLEDELNKPICDTDTIKKITDRLKTTTENLKNMIKEFKNYGKPIILNKKKCSFNKIIQDEIWIAHPPQGRIKIINELDSRIPELYLDEGKFAETIKELIRNAIKSVNKKVSEEGRIFIQTSLMENTSEVLFSIQDNGPGFPKKFPVFEPFNSTDTQSTGLGLSTVKELIERHHGRISAYNKNNEGACIEFVIPINKL